MGFSKTLETSCHQGDCLNRGWTTIERATGYRLEALSTENNCAKHGWSSNDTDGSHYQVACKDGGCFETGWFSTEYLNGVYLYDDVTCKDGGCLVTGWTVRSSYDAGGTASCYRDDCSRFGGHSFWRGKRSRTTCYGNDCYHRGWKLVIED